MVIEEDFNNKNQLNKILKKVDTIQGKAIIDPQNKTINAKFSATMTGDYMLNDGFTPKQLEQLGLVMDAKIEPIKKDIKDIKDRLTNVENRLENVENRLDAVEKDIKVIKNCPTIERDMKRWGKNSSFYFFL